MSKNGLMMQYFESYLEDDGSLWKNLSENAASLKDLGISAVWIPPCYKGTSSGDLGYGVYDVYDLGEFDQKNTVRTKYGTKEELIKAIDALHANGIQVYADIVINHKAGADETEKFIAVEVDADDRMTKVSDAYEIEGWTKFNFSKRANKYSDFKWSHEYFSGTDYNNADGKKAIYLILGENKNWSEGVDYELGNYDYLMFANIDYNNPKVREETLKWIDWFIRETKIDGIRLDAIKHINDSFMHDFVGHIRQNFGEDFYCVGEFWSADKKRLENYMRNTEYKIDLFDVPLHYKFHQASSEGIDFDMSKIFENTLVNNYTNVSVTFVDNHDSQPRESLQSFVESWFKPLAYALILLRMDGYPTIFYGDYYGISGANPIPSQKENLDKLIRIRKENSFGQQFDYFDHNNIIGWVRAGNEEHPKGCAVVMSNGEAGEKTMMVGEMHSGEIWFDKMGFVEEKVVIDENGNGVFKTNAGSVSAYVRDI